MTDITKVRRDVPLKIAKLIRLTHDTKAVQIDLGGWNMEYQPGQFVMLKMEMRDSGGFKVREGTKRLQNRSYSLSSSPTRPGFIESAIKEMPGGFFSVYISRVAEEGEPVLVSGPYGKFVWDETISRNIVMIAAGSGITPFMGFMRYINDKKLSDVSALLMFSNKTPEDIIFKDEIERLSLENKNIKRVFTITRPETSKAAWSGETGRIDAEKIKKHVTDLSAPTFYLCGPPAMVDDVSRILEGLGVEKERIKTEKYG